MGLFDFIFGSNKKEEVKRSINWNEFEDILETALSYEIDAFSKLHQDEIFYSIALDCNAYYCDILLCANSKEALHEITVKYAETDSGEKYQFELQQMRWGLGDWKYQGFNLSSKNWQHGIQVYLNELKELDGDVEIDQFLVSCANVLLKLKVSGQFNKLKTTEDFKIACMDHEEDIIQSDARIKSIEFS